MFLDSRNEKFIHEFLYFGDVVTVEISGRVYSIIIIVIFS